MAYTVCDLLTEPTVFSYGYAFMVFRKHRNTWTNSEQSTLLILLWCGLFGSSMAVFGVHFVYRFGSIHHNTTHQTICAGSTKHIFLLFLVPVVYFVWWTAVCDVYCRYSPETYTYLKNITNSQYQEKIEDISYISTVFYVSAPDGTRSFHQKGWIAMCQFSVMVGSSMFCVFYLGFQCYSQISDQLSKTESKVANALQKQLFFALVGQTIIPLTLMYIPICVFFFCPLLNVNIGVVSTFLAHTITLYPAIDPLPNMLIIKNYRNAIKEMWREIVSIRTKKHRNITVTSVHSTMRHL